MKKPDATTVITERIFGIRFGHCQCLDDALVRKNGEESIVKSVGNSTTTVRDLVNNTDVKLIIYVLAESVAARLRKHGLKCKTVAIHVRDKELCSFESAAHWIQS